MRFSLTSASISLASVVSFAAALPNPSDTITSYTISLAPEPTFSSYSASLPASTWVVPEPFIGAGEPGSPGGTTNITTNPNPQSGLFVEKPDYQAHSDFDFQSLQLVVHQEYIELYLFQQALLNFTLQDFLDFGLSDADRFLVEWMGEQEVGHAKVVSDMLGPKADKECTFEVPVTTVGEFVDFSQKITRLGESGVYGFLNQLDNRASAQILLQSIATEARQQMIFRQFEGLFPMPVWFETAITQDMAWTYLSRYIKSCPSTNLPVEWTIFPFLNITNNPSGLVFGGGPNVSTNTSAPTYAGRQTNFTWDAPGKIQGPYNQTTSILTTDPYAKYAAWVSQYNVTYTPLTFTSNSTAYTYQPNGTVLGFGNDNIINGTMFIALVSDTPVLTPANLSLINNYIVAGPDIFQSG